MFADAPIRCTDPSTWPWMVYLWLALILAGWMVPDSSDAEREVGRVASTGWVLFGQNDPTKILALAGRPIFMPTHERERVGQVPEVVFVEGLVREEKRWPFYYGGADKHMGVASAPKL